MSLPPPRAPAPQTIWLPSVGLKESRATVHEFVRREAVPPDTLKYANGPRSMRPGEALIYRCTETGVERRWGLE